MDSIHSWLFACCCCLLIADSALLWPLVPSWTDFFWTNSSTKNYREESARVMNFLPVPGSTECLANDGRRKGMCTNAYECKIQNGVSMGQCAVGFGVCCVFSAECGSEVVNNGTYFTNPKFPGLIDDIGECTVSVKKMSPEISQIRLDFIHFNLAQPNRKTGVCETDIFVMRGGSYQDIKLCGINSGQHVYYDVENVDEPIAISIILSQKNSQRMWEIKISQIEFRHRAPAGCTQYFHEPTGIIQTHNFAINGRHLANQDYVICMRQGAGMCSIAYEPCDENSFKIGPPVNYNDDLEGSGDDENGSILDLYKECSDRILMPCDSEEFITPGGGSAVCDLLHCGNSFCSNSEKICRIESSTTPFHIRVQFGPGIREESPEDNIGMCLKYEQLACV